MAARAVCPTVATVARGCVRTQNSVDSNLQSSGDILHTLPLKYVIGVMLLAIT